MGTHTHVWVLVVCTAVCALQASIIRQRGCTARRYVMRVSVRTGLITHLSLHRNNRLRQNRYVHIHTHKHTHTHTGVCQHAVRRQALRVARMRIYILVCVSVCVCVTCPTQAEITCRLMLGCIVCVCVCVCVRVYITQAEITCMLNRVACRLKLGQIKEVIDDCTSVLETQPDNAKALFRRGQALVRDTYTHTQTHTNAHKHARARMYRQASYLCVSQRAHGHWEVDK